MGKYIIKDAKVGVSKGGIACGPIGGTVVASVLYESPNGERKWLHCCETDGNPAFYKSADDIHDRLVDEDWEDQAFWDRVNCELFIEEFGGIRLSDYEETLRDLAKGDPAAPLIRLLIALVRCDWETTESLIIRAKTTELDDLAVPKIDVEAD